MDFSIYFNDQTNNISDNNDQVDSDAKTDTEAETKT